MFSLKISPSAVTHVRRREHLLSSFLLFEDPLLWCPPPPDTHDPFRFVLFVPMSFLPFSYSSSSKTRSPRPTQLLLSNIQHFEILRTGFWKSNYWWLWISWLNFSSWYSRGVLFIFRTTIFVFAWKALSFWWGHLIFFQRHSDQSQLHGFTCSNILQIWAWPIIWLVDMSALFISQATSMELNGFIILFPGRR